MIYISIVSFILGIIFEQVFGMGWSVGAFVFFVSLIIYFVLSRDRKYWAKIFLLVGVSLAVGIFRMSLVDISPDSDLVQKVGEKVSFEAKVVDEPDLRDVNARYVVSLEDHKSKILLISNRFPEYQYGDILKVSGKLDLPENFTGDTGVEFDYISYLSKDNIHFLIYQPAIELVGSDSGLKVKIFSALYNLKYKFIEKISNVVPEPNASLLSGMIFGAKQSLGSDLLDQFKNVGLIHIVVLSGYNITIIAVGIFYVLSFFGKRNLSFILSTICILFFAIMIGLSATVIRACIMALIAILARFLGRPADALRWLFIALLLMLLYNPLSLSYDPSFQLSFMATLGPILFSPFVYQFLSLKFPFITEKFALREIVASTFAVQFFILPLLIKMSGSVSIISFLVNPLILPLTPLVMALGGLTGSIGLVSHLLSWPFGTLSYFVTELIIKVVEFSSSLHFASLFVGSLSNLAIFVWYAFYGWVYFRLKTPPGLRPPSPRLR